MTYTDDSPSFANGVELGMLFQRMQYETEVIETLTHPENRDVLSQATEYLGWDISIKPTEVEGLGLLHCD